MIKSLFTKKSEIRKDYLLNKYVIITPERARRPRDLKEETVLSRTNPCPFCLEKIPEKNILDGFKKNGKWQTMSIKNLYPAVTLDNKDAYGVQEVIVETPSHTKELAELSEKDIEQVLRLYARRTLALSRNKNLEYILCFKNQGSKAGASIVHAHSQIFATKVVPPEIREELALAQDYQMQHKRCPYCDILKKEAASPRKIFEDRYVVAFAPYASQFHYEAWIFTRRHLDNITKLNPSELRSFAKVMKKILGKLGELNLSFNYFLHQCVSDKSQHFYLKIQPRDSIWAGVELGSGLIINSVPPERAARFYRKK